MILVQTTPESQRKFGASSFTDGQTGERFYRAQTTKPGEVLYIGGGGMDQYISIKNNTVARSCANRGVLSVNPVKRKTEVVKPAQPDFKKDLIKEANRKNQAQVKLAIEKKARDFKTKLVNDQRIQREQQRKKAAAVSFQRTNTQQKRPAVFDKGPVKVQRQARNFNDMPQATQQKANRVKDIVKTKGEETKGKIQMGMNGPKLEPKQPQQQQQTQAKGR